MSEMKFIMKADKQAQARQQSAVLVDSGVNFSLSHTGQGDYEFTVDSSNAGLMTYAGNDCSAWISAGVITIDDGEKVNLLKIQATLNQMFGETGDNRLAAMANELAVATGLTQGPHEEWEEIE